MNVIISNTWSIIATFFSRAVESESKVSENLVCNPHFRYFKDKETGLSQSSAIKLFFTVYFNWKLVTFNLYLLFLFLVSVTMENCSWSSSLYISDHSYNGSPQPFLQTKHFKFISLYSQCMSTPLLSFLHSLFLPEMRHSEPRWGVASPRLSRDK